MSKWTSDGSTEVEYSAADCEINGLNPATSCSAREMGEKEKKFAPKKFYEIDPWDKCYKTVQIRNL
jgi:hypothetical protein